MKFFEIIIFFKGITAPTCYTMTGPDLPNALARLYCQIADDVKDIIKLEIYPRPQS